MTELQPAASISPVQPPAPKQSSSLLMVILVLLVLFSLAGMGFLYWQNQQLTLQLSSPTVTPTAEATATNQPFTLNETTLVGIWHNSPSMGSGWNDHYNFYASGKYKLYYNEMDCAKTISDESGLWTLKGSTLTLTVKQNTVLKGGHLVPATGSCASQQELDGAHPENVVLSTPQTRILNLVMPQGSVKWGSETIKLDTTNPTMLFGKDPFWKFGNDPTGYNNEFPEGSDTKK
jgi:hypothetical protein